ncbi:arylsulfatase A-like enzyme [Dyadobacter jejuensis]|uniref:Arylsulfatase A-like enzyme n=1 Tax=Dyadobacter jejuensis TaxID=1082580 RepID=A0A316ASW8_9BACT|nr:sulfatase-like hydrolase/transferase [Dyadobacter jejuensis]PWJ60364.1 arylsulfatase A-like enzyme [Dyadobacter jejuensis]
MKRLLSLLITMALGVSFGKAEKLPNILWITSEDNSAFLGCYGDPFATTPHLDALAKKGFRYTHAYANAPVCAPTRNTIITGVYANSGGNQYMRSTNDKSEQVKFFPTLLRDAGYYCTNNNKEDYNVNGSQTKNIWNESGKNAHYKNRKPGQPFFAVFNSTISHESSIHKLKPEAELRHNPKKVSLPPYHPDTPAMRRDWAQYYDKVEDMDTWVGKLLQELEESGEAENTIVFYYADHGGVLGRSKRFVYETGTHVPFIIHIPEKYKQLWPNAQTGTTVDRLISFVDLAPTLLSIVDRPIPAYLQGVPFLGSKKSAAPRYVFMFKDRMDERYDMSRAVRDNKYRYIRNYTPFRPHGQHIEYLWRAASLRSWEEEFKAGRLNETQAAFWKSKPTEELYDTENDPWEINNLAEKPEYQAILKRLQKANRDWMLRIKDTGFIPEAELMDRTASTTSYDYMRSGKFELEPVLNAAELATTPSVKNIPELTALLRADDAAKRYWGATGLLILGEKAKPAITALKIAAKDKSPNVATAASEALYHLGEKELARKSLIAVLNSPNSFARTHALTTLDYLNDSAKETQQAVIAMTQKYLKTSPNGYDLRASQWLIEKWGINPEKYQIDFKF